MRKIKHKRIYVSSEFAKQIKIKAVESGKGLIDFTDDVAKKKKGLLDEFGF